MGRPSIHTSVEDCLRLDAASDAVRPQLQRGGFGSGAWNWSIDGERIGSIGYRMQGFFGDRLTMQLNFSVTGRPVQQTITAVQTRPNYGGVRWWFLCPVASRAGRELRVRCLFKPPGQALFASRIAHSLNYESQKRSSLSRTISRMLRG